MEQIDYDNLPRIKVSDAEPGTQVKLIDDPRGRVFVVGAPDTHGFIDLHRGGRVEVSAPKGMKVVVQTHRPINVKAKGRVWLRS